MTALQTFELSKTYRPGAFKRKNILALDKVSLQVEEGEIFGLLGPNGAGKTTFVKVALSMVHPTSGSAIVLGLPLGSVQIRQQSGYLPESHRYPGFLSGFETLMLFGRLSGVPVPLLKTRAGELLERVGLSQWAGMRTKRYSKGMLQRLGLAQALINEPRLLFLDEPTDGVDPIGRKEIRDILLQLKQRGTTIFLNSHLLSEVELLCDRVVILNKGRVLKTGTIAELTAREPVYEIQLASPAPAEVLQELAARTFDVTARDTLLFARVRDVEQLNALVDLLRSRGVAIGSMGLQKTSLEESFISLIQGETAA